MDEKEMKKKMRQILVGYAQYGSAEFIKRTDVPKIVDRLVKKCNLQSVSNSVCPINNSINIDKCIYRGDKCRVCLDD